MKLSKGQRIGSGFTLLELLCVMVLITILAGMLLGPLSRVLRNGRAMKWSQDAEMHLHAIVQQLHNHFAGKQNFPTVTLAVIEAAKLVEPEQIQFLKDRRVAFVPFAGSDPEDKIVILVRLESGFLTEAGVLTETKGRITRPD